MRIFITGGTGFIGQAVVNNLKKTKHHLLILSRKKQQSNNPRINFILGTLQNISKWQKQLEEFKPDMAFHIAWEGLPDHSYKFSEINLKYGLDLIKLLTKLKCHRLIVVGSCFEYGFQKGKITETTLPKTFDAFTAAKHSLRWMGSEIAKEGNMELVWTRIFYVYGPGQHPKSLIPHLVSSIKSGKIPEIRNPNIKNDFIFVEDVADALIKLLNRKQLNEIYNIGSGRLTSILSIINQVFKHFKIKKTYQDGEKIYKDKLGFFYADISKIKKDTGWKPNTTIREGVTKTINSLE